MSRAAVLLVVLATWSGAGRAQSSPSFRLTDHNVNQGGTPAGTIATAASFRLIPGSLGGGPSSAGLSGASYRADAGWSLEFPPPDEVLQLGFGVDKQSLTWSPERSIGSYRVYRDVVTALPALSYGACLSGDVALPSLVDAQDPAAGGEAFFYLVTAVNRLFEEGTKGFRTNGGERGNPSPCP